MWFLLFALSLSHSPFPAEMVIGWHFEGPGIIFVCAVDLCLLLLTGNRKLLFDINLHQCWELSEDVTVGGQFHIEFPLKVSDHVLLLLVEGL